ncbi:hypothetical protein LZ30DRAFT_793486 [Colletotrichum cereale]|nr:hypothetical protein LZ30DRAFT_793486 [Colletotrichum cereale]
MLAPVGLGPSLEQVPVRQLRGNDGLSAIPTWLGPEHFCLAWKATNALYPGVPSGRPNQYRYLPTYLPTYLVRLPWVGILFPRHAAIDRVAFPIGHLLRARPVQHNALVLDLAQLALAAIDKTSNATKDWLGHRAWRAACWNPAEHHPSAMASLIS